MMPRAPLFPRWPSALVLCVAAVCIGACDRTPSRSASVQLQECRLPRYPLAAQCGTIEVPENRQKSDSRRIRVAFAVLSANTLTPKPDPLFMLAGGPGQAATFIGPLAAQFTGVRRYRDIVLIDQRGTGRSSALECAAFAPPDTPEGALELDPLPRANECIKELTTRGVDPAQYTTANWIADVDAVREALGYERVNLWGGSYGTRAALEYARHYPQRVRSMVLDGVAPPSMKIALDVWPTRDAAIAAAFDACMRSATCREHHLDFKATLAALDEHLSGGRDMTVADPRTGDTRNVHMSLDHVAAMLQSLVYLPEFASLMPEAARRAADGDFAPLQAAAAAMTSGLVEQINAALYYSVTCAEDVPRITPEERERKLADLLSRNLAERGLAVCDVWPRGAMASDAATPLVSDIPALLLSGGLDPVTPPAYGDEVAKSLRNSRHVIAAGYGHNVSPHACAPRLIAAFLEDPGFGTLPQTCPEHFARSTRPPMWPDRLAPQP